MRGDNLSAGDVYAIWQIRDAVFGYEQRVDDVDVDGRDLLADTTHLWYRDELGITSYLRVLSDGDCYRIGRVCTRRDQRGAGLAGALLRTVHQRWCHVDIALGAQTQLQRWYAQFGYQQAGQHYNDAGIDHVPMIRPAMSPPQSNSQ